MPLDPHKITMLGNVQIVPDGGESDLEQEGGTGKVFYVCNATSGLPVGGVTGSNSYNGDSPQLPLSTIDYAIGLCTAARGDKIIVMAGHAETVTTAITMDISGVTIEGRGRGALKPTVSCATASINEVLMSAANCSIENIRFAAATGAVTSVITVSAADCVVRGCDFLCGASNTNAIVILDASADFALVKGNEFRVTANGPDIGVSISAAGNDGSIIVDNLFNGGSTTNQWDTAAINSTAAHTNCIIEKNTFLYGTAMVVATSVSTLVRDNVFGVNAVPNAVHPMTFYADNGTTVRTGLHMTTPTTVADALSKARSGVGDSVLLLPGTYTLSAALAISDAALRFGPAIDSGAFNVTITTASDVDLITLTGASVEIWGIRFVANAAQTTTPMIIDLDTGDFCHIHDCYFDQVSVASLTSIDIASSATDTLIRNNYFVAAVASGATIIDLGARTKILNNFCNQVAADSSFITNTGLATGGYFYNGNCIVGDGGSNGAMTVIAAAVEGMVANNRFAGTSSATPVGQAAGHATRHLDNMIPTSTGTVVWIDPVA